MTVSRTRTNLVSVTLFTLFAAGCASEGDLKADIDPLEVTENGSTTTDDLGFSNGNASNGNGGYGNNGNNGNSNGGYGNSNGGYGNGGYGNSTAGNGNGNGNGGNGTAGNGNGTAGNGGNGSAGNGNGTAGNGGNGGNGNGGNGYGYGNGGNGSTYNNPPDVQTPPETIDECVATVVIPDAEEIWLGSYDSPVYTTLDVVQEGWYELYNEHIQESGATQRNESAYFHVINATNPGGQPLLSNCDGEWVVVDNDNDGLPALSQSYIGTFWLDAGSNEIEMLHYCHLYRAGQCANLHDAVDAGATCDSGNINSVHFYGNGVCIDAVY